MGRLKFIQMSTVGRHLKYAALPNIAITSETRRACFTRYRVFYLIYSARNPVSSSKTGNS